MGFTTGGAAPRDTSNGDMNDTVRSTASIGGLTRVARESDTSLVSGPLATALKDYCIPGGSGPHSCPHTLALFNTGLHSLNSKLNPPSGLLGMTDTVNIVESVCRDPGRAALPEKETHSQNIVLRWKTRPGTTVAQDEPIGAVGISGTDTYPMSR